MVKYRNAVLFLMACIVLGSMAGCGKKQRYTDEQIAAFAIPTSEGLPVVEGGLTLRVAGDTIKSEEIIGQTRARLEATAKSTTLMDFKRQARPMLENYMQSRVADLLLYSQAKGASSENIDEAIDKYARQEIRRYIGSFGGNLARAEAALKSQGYDWQSFEKYQKRIILVQSFLADKMPEEQPVTYSELEAKYNELKDEKFTAEQKLHFSLIDIKIDEVEQADANVAREDGARQLAAELVGRLGAGEDFSALAEKYSHGPGASSGGAWNPVNPQSLASPYDILAEKAEEMEIGTIGGPFEKDGHLFVMKLHAKPSVDVASLVAVQKELEATIRLERRTAAVDKISERIVSQANIPNKDVFIDFCLKRIYEKSNY